ncbi:MAG: hypothetical protein EA404_00255 [Spirochaetaceae bacterium]|nr:MAG: hypothetical protein EA404_00255 [Spirochaetaceae bacterium]
MPIAAIAAYATLAWVSLRLILDRPHRHGGLAAIRLQLLLLMLLAMLPVAAQRSLIPTLIAVVLVTVIDLLLITLLRDRDLGRAMATLVSVLLVMLLFSDARITTGFNQPARDLFELLFRGNRMIGSVGEDGFAYAMMFMAGMLLSALEANHVVIYVLRRLQLGPVAPQPQYRLFADKDKGRGKVIGYLERALVFSLVLSGNLGGIGFVLAAKALARFRELDTREFAEYVLIGTLVSVGMAALIGALFGALRF